MTVAHMPAAVATQIVPRPVYLESTVLVEDLRQYMLD